MTTERERTGWSLDLLIVRNIPIRVHYSFFLLPLYVLMSHSGGEKGVTFELGLLLLMVTSIALHELGHALTARMFGIETRDIVIYPFGGIATVHGQAGPRAELFVAAAGPLVSIAIAILLFPFTKFSTTFGSYEGQVLMTQLFVGNIILALFNLIPALPMDGGRVLRASMLLIGVNRATAISGRISQILSGLLIILSLYYSLVIPAIIGVLVFMQASQEILREKTNRAIAGLRVRDVMVDRINIETLSHGMSVAEALACIMKSFQDFFPVTHGSNVIGIIARDELLKAAAIGENTNYIAEYMERELDKVSPDQFLSMMLDEIDARSAYPVLVFDTGGFAGLVLRDAVSELLFLEGFREKR